ncbi:hypothetical protein EDEG_01524 [Edhazardia aedis USNM 41457]|uniref:Uncharacterized protein n=1 Tax=Edhazardia aedis (strain USNM 41457) TaxID=1003232 RepID=J9DSA9_EDHAE|nr:hypothetical protein EDEG_01524 [Edhazardia aedis USNM 41457]|eukprot:EJW04192.1 hypothetical protein EDEG_01524 [Edhazardia aedis USNM 41457]
MEEKIHNEEKRMKLEWENEFYSILKNQKGEVSGKKLVEFYDIIYEKILELSQKEVNDLCSLILEMFRKMEENFILRYRTEIPATTKEKLTNIFKVFYIELMEMKEKDFTWFFDVIETKVRKFSLEEQRKSFECLSASKNENIRKQLEKLYESVEEKFKKNTNERREKFMTTL